MLLTWSVRLAMHLKSKVFVTQPSDAFITSCHRSFGSLKLWETGKSVKFFHRDLKGREVSLKYWIKENFRKKIK